MSNRTPIRVTGTLIPSGTQDVEIIAPIPLPTTEEGAVTSVVTRVNSATSSHTLVVANASRRGLLFYNDSNAYQYLKLGTTASLTDFTVRLVPQVFYEVAVPIYLGQIDVVSSSTDGAIQVTELS